MYTLSVLSVDVGFDPREHDMLLRLACPLRGVFMVRHHPAGTCLNAIESVGTIADVAESLARAGYAVVVALTANGRDVQCSLIRPAFLVDGPGYDWSGPIWSIQHKSDNYWCIAPTLHAALERSGWQESDLRPLSDMFKIAADQISAQ